jgi:hypothetical protein
MNACAASAKAFVATVGLITLTSGSARAADLPIKAPVLAAPTWTAPPVPMFGDFFDLKSRAPFKIAENESPRPTDRVFFTYNYYDNVGGSSGVNIHRETVGFEKTLLNGDASFGVRFPLFQTDTTAGVEHEFGDLTFIAKYALLNDPATGNVLTAGLAVTAPTGQIPHAFDPFNDARIQSTLLQPFVGYQVAISPDVFIHGFSSVLVPTDPRETTLLFNDIGLGYWAYRASGNGITGIVLTGEAHVNTLLDSGVVLPPEERTQFNAVFGARALFSGGQSLGVAIGVPVTGPKPFDIEAMAQFNWHF